MVDIKLSRVRTPSASIDPVALAQEPGYTSETATHRLQILGVAPLSLRPMPVLLQHVRLGPAESLLVHQDFPAGVNLIRQVGEGTRDP